MNRSPFFAFVLFLAVNVAAAEEITFEAINIDDDAVVGTLTSLNAKTVAFRLPESTAEITVDKLIKIRNLHRNPYLPQDSVNRLTQNRPSRYGLPRDSEGRKLAQSIQAKLSAENRSEKNAKELPQTVIVLEVSDTSRLLATSFIVKGTAVTCRLLNNEEVTMPLDNILTVRFAVRGLTEITAPPADWLRLAVPEKQGDKGDKIVVGSPGSLDVYTGILQEVGAETISFIVDGETLPVPRRKVFGIVLHAAPKPAMEPVFGILTLWNGQTALLSKAELNEKENLAWRTVSGVSGTSPLDEIDEIDFGRKNAFYLTDLTPVRLEQAFPFETKEESATQTATQTATLDILKTYRANQIKPQTGQLDGVSYERSLMIPAKTVLEYRLTEPFAAFRAVAGIDDRYRPNAAATLQIQADEQFLGSWLLRGDGGAERLQLSLPTGTTQLKITVDFPNGFSVPGLLTIADPMLVK